MNIKEEKISEQNALLKIELQKDDYSEQYNAALKDYRKKMNLPGFRAGKVPLGLVKQRFGKSLLADELNKMLNEKIQGYIAEKKLNVLGSPIPSEEHTEQGDWDNPSDFEFVYELGLAPELDVTITEKDNFNYYTIKVDDKMLDKQIDSIARRYGQMSEAKEAGENDMIIGDFVELDENDEIKEGGIMNQGTISLEFVDPDAAKKFIGKKVGEDAVVDPHKVARDHDDLAKMLDISHEAVHGIDTNFKFIIREVKHLEPAELNQEFFDKVFGEGEVEGEKEFRQRMTEELQKGFVQDSDRLFKRDVTQALIEKYDPSLPDSFLKKWIRMSNEKPITAEEVERDYDSYRKGLQWQLIFNTLIEKKEITIENEEVIERTKSLMAQQYQQYGMPAPEDEELQATAMKVLSNQEESRKVFDMLYDEKLVDYIRKNATVKEKAVDYDKFVEMASKG